jgi:transcriptional regulator with PAS, ATPase and Fis domain
VSMIPGSEKSLVSLVDISDRKRMEQQIRENEERLRSIYAASPIGIAVFNEEGRVFDMNASFRHMFVLPENVDYAQVDFSLFDHIAEMKNSKSKLIKNGGMNFESGNDFKFAKNNDFYEFIPTEKRFLNWHITPLGVKESTASLFLAQVQDITERKQSEEAKLKEARKVAAEANRVVEGLRKEINQSAQFHNMVSRNPAMQEIFNILPEISQASTTVLITGESGTGKELIAKSIHELSPRKSKAFIAINCGALPDNLLESELFGYKAGAFTDAKKDKPGKFALADGGTIFLDEIGDISPAMQVKLLRVLQEKTFDPLGAAKSVSVDVRVVAATNKNLPEIVKEGKFREDLYYRIKVLNLALPGLRDRKSDIPLLCDHFISLFNARFKKSIKELSNKAFDALLAHDYPGNIRELENILEHAFIFCKGSVIEPKHLPPEITTAASPHGKPVNLFAEINSFEELERMFLRNILMENSGSRIKTAEKLGIHKATLFRKMKSLGIEGV